MRITIVDPPSSVLDFLNKENVKYFVDNGYEEFQMSLSFQDFDIPTIYKEVKNGWEFYIRFNDEYDEMFYEIGDEAIIVDTEIDDYDSNVYRFYLKDKVEKSYHQYSDIASNRYMYEDKFVDEGLYPYLDGDNPSNKPYDFDIIGYRKKEK